MHFYFNIRKTPSLHKKMNMYAYIINMHKITLNMHKTVLLQMEPHIFTASFLLLQIMLFTVFFFFTSGKTQRNV